ncbi:hypothetical protein HDU67_009379 [Dinochytrium kinnereticum]|nr:hypothetical protein HDU67_009379 [Dinochytrium kinnereticum]
MVRDLCDILPQNERCRPGYIHVKRNIYRISAEQLRIKEIIVPREEAGSRFVEVTGWVEGVSMGAKYKPVGRKKRPARVRLEGGHKPMEWDKPKIKKGADWQGKSCRLNEERLEAMFAGTILNDTERERLAEALRKRDKAFS